MSAKFALFGLAVVLPVVAAVVVDVAFVVDMVVVVFSARSIFANILGFPNSLSGIFSNGLLIDRRLKVGAICISVRNHILQYNDQFGLFCDTNKHSFSLIIK